MPHRRSQIRLSATFALTLVTMLAGPPALSAGALAAGHGSAQARKASCPGAPTPKVKHRARACAQSKQQGNGKARHASKHHARHAGKAGAVRPVGHLQAICEDSSTPLRAADGSFSCQDGSEPGCQDGSAPALSGNGTTLLCPLPAQGEAGCEGKASGECTFGGGSELTCEDASSPIPASEGSVVCEDGSEPACEDASNPMLSPDGSTLLCEAAAPVADSSD